MDGNLSWLTLKNEDPNCNKGNFVIVIKKWQPLHFYINPPPPPPPPHTHTHNVTELQSNKKVATPRFLHQPPPTPLQGYFPFLAKFLVSPPTSDSIFARFYCPPLIRGWEGGFNYVYLIIIKLHYQK